MPKQIKKNLKKKHHLNNNILISPISKNSNKFKIFINKKNTPFIYKHLINKHIIIPKTIYNKINIKIKNILTPKNKYSNFNIS